MGTPDFAVASLAALVASKHEVVAVITAVDKPAGRGKSLRPSPVKVYAESQGIMVLQPKNLKAASFNETLAALKADLQVVVAFRMLPAMVFEMPPQGTINLHASLLPQYRGAAPINWAIMNGETESGLTTFFIQQEIDTGAMIYQEKCAISDEMTAGELHDELMQLGANLVVRTVDAIAQGDYPKQEQVQEKELKAAPKIYKDDCKIDWDQPAEKVRNHIRGLSPYPAAFTYIDGKRTKIFRAKKGGSSAEIASGTIYCDNKDALKIACSDFFLEIEELQLAGKKRMATEDLLRGYKLAGKSTDTPT